MPKPQTDVTVDETGTDGLTDGQKLAVKLALMAGVAVASLVGQNLANRAIEKKFGDK
jgi:hypothetical protein